MSSKLTNCKVCGAQIASNAKNCPQCGAKVKKSLLKKVLIAFVVVFAISIAFSMGSDDSTSSNSKLESTPQVTNNDVISNETQENEKVKIYQYLGENESLPYIVTDNAVAFINEHPDLFPVATGLESSTSEFIDSTISFAHLSKNIAKYGSNLMNISGYIVDIEEAPDGSVTVLQIMDYDGNNYMLYYLGVLDDVLEEMEVNTCVLPMDIVTFENMSGAYTEAIVCAACFVNSIA